MKQAQTSRKILVADDERMIAETLAIILRAEGYEAITVYDGAEAVLLADSWRPDIFLSDVVMPVMNGIEAAIRIHQMIPDCRMLLLSGQAETSDLLSDVIARGHYFEILLKPIHPTELLAHLHTICDGDGLPHSAVA